MADARAPVACVGVRVTISDQVSPCGTMTAFDLGARPLVFERFGVVKERAAPNKLLIDLDLPRAYWRRRRLPLSIARGVLPLRVVRAVLSIVGVVPVNHSADESSAPVRVTWGPAPRARVVPGPVCVRYDRTRRGFHVVIWLSESLTRAELVALQACLGSDARREALNLMRVRSMRVYGCPPRDRARWNLLFEEKLS